MTFKQWLIESKQFARLIHPDALKLIPELKSTIRGLTEKYYQDKNSVEPIKKVASLPDPFNQQDFDVYLISAEKWKELNLPNAQGVASHKPSPSTGRRFVAYKIPMTNYDTVYHELVHMYDPKIGKGLENDLPWAQKPSEIDAHMSGVIDEMKEKLTSVDPVRREQLKRELQLWLRKIKSDEDLDPENMPELFKMAVWHLKQKPSNWRKLLTSVYNAIFS